MRSGRRIRRSPPPSPDHPTSRSVTRAEGQVDRDDVVIGEELQLVARQALAIDQPRSAAPSNA